MSPRAWIFIREIKWLDFLDQMKKKTINRWRARIATNSEQKGIHSVNKNEFVVCPIARLGALDSDRFHMYFEMVTMISHQGFGYDS